MAQSLERKTPIELTDSEVQDAIRVADPLLFDTPTDSLGAGGDADVKPVHKRWWVWALVTTGIAVLAVLAGGGEEDKTPEDLPDFPDPPNR
jgi:hypothetical protein